MNRVQSCRCWKGNPSHAEICFIIVVVLLYQSVLFCFFCVLLSLSASPPPFSLTLSCVCGCGSSSSRVAHLSLIDSSPSGFITLLSPPISTAVSCPPLAACRSVVEQDAEPLPFMTSWCLAWQPPPSVYECVCEWVNLTGVAKCCERSVDWKRALEMPVMSRMVVHSGVLCVLLIT